MLEMKETAFICNNTTDQSLVLVDELGRATSNEDGVAIAWSMSEYLLKKHAMTFFVTHYPQITCLASIYPCVQNVHMEAAVTKGTYGEISHAHKVKTGECSVSTDYGIELAAACGWPMEEVQTLMPDNGLCHERSLEQVRYARVLKLVCSSFILHLTLFSFLQLLQ